MARRRLSVEPRLVSPRRRVVITPRVVRVRPLRRRRHGLLRFVDVVLRYRWR
jgi:hypothetical protein